MARTPPATLANHFEEEVTTLARLLWIERTDGERFLLTDHDEDLTLAQFNEAATGTFSIDPVPGGEARATAEIEFDAGENATDGDTITIGTKTYTFQTTLTDSDGNVLIGADGLETLQNLAAAINLGSGSGSVYAASMTEHPTVNAIAPDDASDNDDEIDPDGIGVVAATVGNMAFSTPDGFGNTNESMFDGDISQPFGRSAQQDSANGPAYVGRQFNTPQKINRVIVYGTYDHGFWSPGGGLQSHQIVIELRASQGSLPADPTTGGTLLGSTGPFINRDAPKIGSGRASRYDKDNPLTITVDSNDASTAWDFVWIVIYDDEVEN